MYNLRKIIYTTVKKVLNEHNLKLDDDILYDIAKWGLEDEYATSSCWDDYDDLEDAINCAIDDFKIFLSEPYPFGLGEIPENPIIYRLVRLKNINDLKKDNLGFSWFSNPKQIEEPDFFHMLDYLLPFKNKDGSVFMIKGQTNINNIDIKRTLWERSTQWIENEIVIIDDSKIKILSIRELS